MIEQTKAELLAWALYFAGFILARAIYKDSE